MKVMDNLIVKLLQTQNRCDCKQHTAGMKSHSVMTTLVHIKDENGMGTISNGNLCHISQQYLSVKHNVVVFMQRWVKQIRSQKNHLQSTHFTNEETLAKLITNSNSEK